MDVVKRAWLYITRKRGKSIIMFFMLFAVATAVLSGISIKKATVLSRNEGLKGVSNSFEIRSYGGQSGEISDKAVKKMSEIDGVDKYNASLEDYGIIENVKKVQSTNGSVEYNDDVLKDVFTLIGSENTEIDEKFVNKMIKLVEGRHLQNGDKNKVLLHKSFAELNNYKIGDKIKLKESIFDYDARKVINNESNRKTEVEVVGIFDNVDPNKKRVGPTNELVENTLIIDNNSISELKGYLENGYDKVVFYVKDGVKVDDVISKIKNSSVYSANMEITKAEDLYKAFIGSYDTMDKLINMILIGIIVISAGVLSLILTFWIQGRIHETGILLSIGVPKFKIFAQYVIELLMISVLAFSLSFFSGKFISQGIGESLVEKASKETVQDVQGGFGGFTLGNDIESQKILHTATEIDVKVTPSEMAYVWIVGVGIIVVSVGLSSLSIIRLKPKEILSKMS